MKRCTQTNSSALTACQCEHSEAGFLTQGSSITTLNALFKFYHAKLSLSSIGLLPPVPLWLNDCCRDILCIFKQEISRRTHEDTESLWENRWHRSRRPTTWADWFFMSCHCFVLPCFQAGILTAGSRWCFLKSDFGRDKTAPEETCPPHGTASSIRPRALHAHSLDQHIIPILGSWQSHFTVTTFAWLRKRDGKKRGDVKPPVCPRTEPDRDLSAFPTSKGALYHSICAFVHQILNWENYDFKALAGLRCFLLTKNLLTSDISSLNQDSFVM